MLGDGGDKVAGDENLSSMAADHADYICSSSIQKNTAAEAALFFRFSE
jgi:hypothetical protein